MLIALRLLGWPLKLIGRTVLALCEWAVSDWRHAAIVVLGAAMLVMTMDLRHAVGARDKARAEAVAARADAAHWRDARNKLAWDTAVARAQAEAADRANRERVAREYNQIIERTAHDYQDRLADTRAALERVRGEYAKIAAADRGGPGAAAVPPALAARCRAVGAADCDALLAALPDLLAAAESNTGQLIALQDYVRQTLLIDPSGADETAVSGAVGGDAR